MSNAYIEQLTESMRHLFLTNIDNVKHTCFNMSGFFMWQCELIMLGILHGLFYSLKSVIKLDKCYLLKFRF